MIIYILIAVFVLLLIFTIVEYNSFVQLNNKVKEAFSTMDVYLKKRWDLIPNLVESVKGYAKHEQKTLEEVISLRSGTYNDMSDDKKLKTNIQLASGINKLMLLAERYPDLKANQNFLDLSKQLIQVEDEIANSRKYYNALVRMYNNKVEMFPDNIFACLFSYKKKQMFEIDSEERNNIKVNYK